MLRWVRLSLSLFAFPLLLLLLVADSLSPSSSPPSLASPGLAVGVPIEHLQGGKLAIYELMGEESAVNYWEKYGNVRLGSLLVPISFPPSPRRPSKRRAVKGSPEDKC